MLMSRPSLYALSRLKGDISRDVFKASEMIDYGSPGGVPDCVKVNKLIYSKDYAPLLLTK